jgi:hypothetical protein
MKKNQLIVIILGVLFFQNCQQSADNISPSGNGTGGSLARFTLGDGTLYTVSNFDLNVFDLKASPSIPNKLKTITLGFGAETIFPYKNMLFIGTTTGMKIFDNQDQTNPKLLSTFTHIYSCDPVVVQGNYAYVTLRSGTGCQRGRNSLDIVDIKDPKNPLLLSSFLMQNPHGLAVDGNNLFVCEGTYGLKSFDITDPLKPIEREFIKDVISYDVIPNDKKLIVTGKNGIYQYDYSEPKTLKLISKIPIE